MRFGGLMQDKRLLKSKKIIPFIRKITSFALENFATHKSYLPFLCHILNLWSFRWNLRVSQKFSIFIGNKSPQLEQKLPVIAANGSLVIKAHWSLFQVIALSSWSTSWGQGKKRMKGTTFWNWKNRFLKRKFYFYSVKLPIMKCDPLKQRCLLLLNLIPR